MKPLYKQIIAGVAVAIIMALLYGAKEVTFVAYGADRKAEQNAKDIAEIKDNTKEAAVKATDAANGVARIEGQQQAVLDALQDIQRRLP